MANPKKRKTHGGKRRSASHLALKKTVLNKCPKCGQALRPYSACPGCGYYKGKEIRKVKIKTAKKK